MEDKLFLAVIEERSGEYEFNSKIVVSAADKDEAWEVAQSIVCDWRGAGTPWDRNELADVNSSYEFVGGEVMGKVTDITEVTDLTTLINALGGTWFGQRCPVCVKFCDIVVDDHGWCAEHAPQPEPDTDD